MRRLPLVTLLLCGVMIVVYALSAAAQGGARLSSDTLLRWGALPLPLSSSSISSAARALRFLGAPFLHVDPPHLLGNLAALLIGGAITERRRGRPRTLALFFSGAVGGELCAAAVTGMTHLRPALALGASGGALALLGQALFLRVAAPLRAVSGLCALALLLGGLWLGGDSAAHLGGLGAGLLWAIVPPKRGGSHGR